MIVQVEIIGIDRALTGFARVEKTLTQLKPLWERFAKEFYSEEKQLFDLAPWKPLTPLYAERKRRKYGDKPILRATDTLWKSLTQQGVEGNIHRTSDDEAEFGSAVSYGIFHRDTRNPLAEPDENKYSTIAGQYVAEMIGAAGFN